MSATSRRAAALAVVVVLLAACGDQPEPATEPPSSHELPTATPTTPPPSRSAVEPTPEVEAAVADLAAHLGVDPSQVTVVSHEDVTWPDGSLGCPQPGMSYTMAQVPGSRLVLAAEGREFSYHAGRSGDLARCDSPRLGPTTPPPADS